MGSNRHASPATFKRLSTSKWVDGFMHLLFPERCLVCTTELVKSEQHVCTLCRSELHYTHFELSTEDTPLNKLFWGRTAPKQTYALLYYAKTNASKKLLESLKYKFRPDVGKQFGQEIGRRLKTQAQWNQIEAYIPVPLHPKKQFIRGYNQSEAIAQGISEITGIPVRTDMLKRNIHSKSQTKLGRFSRWDNVDSKFSVRTSFAQYNHIALIDDVITTGATLETLIEIIRKQAPNIQISVISLAFTN